MTGRALLMHLDEHGVAIAVQPDFAYPLAVTTRLTLHPVLPTTAGKERGASRGQGLVQREIIHPPHHQHLTSGVLLNDGRDQSSWIALEQCSDLGVEGAPVGSFGWVRHAPIVPMWGHTTLSFPSSDNFASAVTSAVPLPWTLV